ncbi:HNH endonuclease [Natronorubrum texcoconense]|uniref:HNH endonuclease n=1 Tax=Natronorubrum texcoconense TaxID=1095776 RepID=UPI000B7CA297|nr:HNH endonuclease signature motif containing protein [Natronorubrum texcoconense]
MKNKYPSDWDSRRREVYKRDRYTCQNCGSKGGRKGNTELHAHHIVPISDEGTHNKNNLKTLCKDCHGAVHNEGKVAPTANSSSEKSVLEDGESFALAIIAVIAGGVFGIPIAFISSLSFGEAAVAVAMVAAILLSILVVVFRTTDLLAGVANEPNELERLAKDDVEKFMHHDGLGLKVEIKINDDSKVYCEEEGEVVENKAKKGDITHCAGVSRVSRNKDGEVYITYSDSVKEMYEDAYITAVSGESMAVPITSEKDDMNFMMMPDEGERLIDVNYVRHIDVESGEFKIEYVDGPEEVEAKETDQIIRGATHG